MNKQQSDNKIISKADIILCAVILIAALGFLIIFRLNARTGMNVNISVNGKLVESFSLDKDREYKVTTDSGENLVVISDGAVSVTEADCPDKVCVKHSEISNVGETIICLPHKLVVEIAE